ncbi:protein-L-isoaspartate(D-aspartate) O-methyltransferase [bacterium]|nr:protein-L-isoaspartate(D-aspartate) O-methyltransferase [bacterium]
MVEQQIKARGISNRNVIAAMLKVPRHMFVPDDMVPYAYDDYPLPIGEGQTISQPYIVALMTELLEPKPTDVVLEIGTGSGYQAAVLAQIVKKVYSVERISKLAEFARKNLKMLGINNVEVILGDGWYGLPEHAPYNGIIVTAAPEDVPKPLLDQLADEGRLVIPIGTDFQRLWVIRREGEIFERIPSIPVRFVPLISEKPE